MKTILRISLALGLFAGGAHAFSLLGPYDTWMQPTNGFHLPGDIGGPMNLGEEYRWNVPVLTYTFDPSFLDYFGSNGVAAVEQAIEILNHLPPASQLDPANYPPEATRWNYSAQALNLTNVKSKTLAVLLEQLGLTQPTRHAFDVHDFEFVGGNPVAQIVIRNFDPITFAPTNWVNDFGHGYVLTAVTNGSTISVSAEEYNLLDPWTLPSTAVADDAAGMGGYYTDLTRDDTGGLRYLLHTNNVNLEPLLPGVHGIGPNAGAYVNQALRPGVDKITFVRRDYDGLLGQFFTPYTNQFTDYYLSNQTVVAQQLERVITAPDILFSAGNDNQGIVTNALITRTGTTNWLNNAFPPGAAGPGIIRPPIKLSYSKPAITFVSMDTPPYLVGYDMNLWGSFDGSTNQPVNYPLGAAASDLSLNLHLLRNETEIGQASWQIPLTPGDYILVETSTNLVNWSFHSLFSAGRRVEWFHHISDARRYFRIVPHD
ncbi:MAG: hypothetical protein U1F83_09250 [Verrucomicrobiota bacterium]